MYVILAVPAETPVTMPELLPIVATEVLLLLHVPPVVALLSVMVNPKHVGTLPVMGVAAILVMEIDPLPVVL